MSRGSKARRRRMANAREAVRHSFDGWDLAGHDDTLRRAIEIESPRWSRDAADKPAQEKPS